ncbi:MULTISPECIES: hypothetical protein [unclassified Crossiella]|uniref:hypothetical protein n=1 Tax=unclassified Crossiella TaxID=2620835 RepID=UPI001FFEB640|nr:MULTISPECIES: hypothetical protein [unclassified Crossiella]MCK2243811.1 hypothetical protein [Crossiella sp. S99.2]MCK2257670.1 hypothetical protein [Crossiella sp. S99.1]
MPTPESVEPAPDQPPEPASQEEALDQLHTGGADHQDLARSMAILTDAVRRLPTGTIKVDRLTLFNDQVSLGGDLVTGGGGRRGGRPGRVSGPAALSPEHVFQHTRGFVAPQGYADALGVLEERNLLVLTGPSGTGRQTAAMRMLLDTAQGQDFVLLPPSTLGNSSWRVPRPGGAYLVVDDGKRRFAKARAGRPPTTTEAVDDAWLTRTSELLKDTKSFLVVVTGEVRGKLATATRREEFVGYLDQPDSLEIVAERVRQSEAAIGQEELERRLNAAGVPELLAERPQPSFAVRVAKAVIEGLTAGADLAEALRGLRDPYEQAEAWLGDDPASDEIAIALATAVLDESGYLTVADAAVDLNRSLAGQGGPTMRYRRALLAEHTWIEVAESTREGGAETPMGGVLRFRNPQMRSAVLTHAWHELDGARPRILSWLHGLVRQPDVEVRARAATAAGILANTDFGYAQHRFLQPWAASGNPVERQSAALALSVVGALGTHHEQVWALLNQWANDGSPGARRYPPLTAALALGGPLGGREPVRALRLLGTLLQTGGWNLLAPIGLSVRALAEQGHVAETMNALLDWSEEETDEATVKALTAFVVLVQGIPGAGGAERIAVPTMLAEAGRFRAELPELWGRALDNLAVRPLALSALRDWLRLVDADWTLYPDVLDLFGGIADRGDEAVDLLEYHLENWARDEHDPSTSAAHIFDALAEAGEPPS